MADDSNNLLPDPVKCSSFKQLYHLFGCINLTFIIVGTALIIVGIVFFFISFCTGDYFFCIPTNPLIGYISTIAVLAGSTLYMLGKHKRRIDLKTAAYSEEIKALIADVEQGLKLNPDTSGKLGIESQLEHLRSLDKDKEREVSYLDLIHLRKQQVDLFNEDDLESNIDYDLLEFGNVTEKDSVYFTKYKTIIDKARQSTGTDRINKLRSTLKTLREAHQWEMFTAGRGEAILESMTHWGIYATPSLVLLGMMPLLFPPDYFQGQPLPVYNWIFLGITGAVLYSINRMRSLDSTKVGEDEGSLTLRRMLLGVMVGMISAVLLYAALRGEILDGKIFPDITSPDKPAIDDALSLFWGIFSGFSVKLVDILMDTAERTISSSVRGANPSERNDS